jgi:hypothetical protein
MVPKEGGIGKAHQCHYITNFPPRKWVFFNRYEKDQSNPTLPKGWGLSTYAPLRMLML